MENLFSRLQALADQDEKTLKPLLETVFTAIGIPASKREQILENLPAVKEKVKELKPEQLDAILQSLGEERVGGILRALEKAQNG